MFVREWTCSEQCDGCKADGRGSGVADSDTDGVNS